MTLTDRVSRLPFVRRALIDNPLARAEQRRMRRYGVGRRPLIGLLMLVCLIGGPIMLMLHALVVQLRVQHSTNSFLSNIVFDLDNAVRLSAIVGVLAIIGQNFMITNLAPRLAGATLARERQNGTWEPLVLTGIGARRIVIGKWAAITTTVLERHRRALLLRVPLVVWVMFVALRADVMRSNLLIAPALVTLIMLLVTPVLLAGCFTAIGMAASSLVSRETMAARLNGLIPIVMIVAGFALAWLLGRLLPYTPEDPEGSLRLYYLGLGVFLPLVDSGMLGIPIWFDTVSALASFEFYFIGNLLWIGLMSAATWMLLRVAGWASVRAGAIGGRETVEMTVQNTV